MPVNLAQSQIINQISEHLYSFLPGKPHPLADPERSFPGAANKVGLGDFWKGGSKRPAIVALLRDTLEFRRELFCSLMLEIVNRGLTYRLRSDPISRDEIEALNQLILGVNFKIPELWDPKFLNSLPKAAKRIQVTHKAANSDVRPPTNDTEISVLKEELLSLNEIEPRSRGFAFERFLNRVFDAYGLEPRNSFRLVGEQIDGSLQHDGVTYLIEAKWQNQQIGQHDLSAFQDQVRSKSSWSRGLFISYSGFTLDGLEAFSRGRSTNIIGLDGRDIFYVLEGHMTLSDALTIKARRAAETGQFFASIHELSLAR